MMQELRFRGTLRFSGNGALVLKAETMDSNVYFLPVENELNFKAKP